ncbi:DUF397 domain-containing protein [Streptomyces syringium]|uniref:DUF397 domain-containing protein n=1 Tax=Streptomyces syringium TaxID=76729 RepID=UPI0033CE14B7
MNHEPASVTWRRSSYCGTQGECLEIADGLPGLTPVRDSKNLNGPILPFSAAAWSVFITALKGNPAW